MFGDDLRFSDILFMLYSHQMLLRIITRLTTRRSNGAVSMAFSPMHEFEAAVSRAAFAAAPEKAETLFSRVKDIKLEFLYDPQQKAGSFKFSANPETRVIKVSEDALELPWAASFALATVFQICRDS
jgi:hypothetical protein